MEKNTTQEQLNKEIIQKALAQSAHDFTLFFEHAFSEDATWTIAGHGPVARTYHGLKDLFDHAEAELFKRFAQPLAIKTLGVWADGNEVFARIQSSTVAIDDKPYRNEYMYIMTLQNGQVVSGIEWLDLNAYYAIIDRISI